MAVSQELMDSTCEIRVSPLLAQNEASPIIGTHIPLSMDEGRRLLVIHGKNSLRAVKKVTWWQVFGRAMLHPFNFILLGLATVSGATKDFTTLSIMCTMVILSVLLRIVQVEFNFRFCCSCLCASRCY